MAGGDGVQEQLKVAFIPGTGRMGSLLAGHLARAGMSIFVGSRSQDKGLQTAQKLLASCPNARIQGGSNHEAAAWANTIFWSPSGSLQERENLVQSLAAYLKNKIIIDVSNVMYFFDESKWGQTSSVLLNQKALGVPARWTTAFKATFYKLLEELPDPQNPHHTFVAGDDEEAVLTTIALVESIPGFKAVKAGGLSNSKIIELLGPLWLFELDKLNAGGNYRSGWKYAV
ncbi:hypothetical protein GOP47_0017748 [Adiantum capillus-veneris]|uniref:Pyrroline-5-carboxylate reductase catalytic N-terminal domain-containing protein n=1 Tax=Adiantum capillus-veneris TaxID=13818 RepID=A0A9D4UG16_ADICA|nr:hypothetical protein GOP47_0017748 [Adiantum capillus-veneris]